MSNNPISRNNKVVLAQGEDMADGMTQIQDAVGLKQTRDMDLRGIITQLKGQPLATPPVPGLIYLFDQALKNTGLAATALSDKDDEVYDYLSNVRAVLVPILGKKPSAEWVLAGFTEPGSTAVPKTQEDRFASLAANAIYFTQNPTYERNGPPPHPVITAARSSALHTELSDARSLVNTRRNQQEQAKDARDSAFDLLRRREIASVDELTLLLAGDDPRWEVFGLNIPASPRAPEAATNLVLSPAGTGRVFCEWRRGTRSDDNRVLIKIIGTDTEFHEVAKSGDAVEYTIKNLTSGMTVRVKIIALNGSLEASDGPEAEIVVP